MPVGPMLQAGGAALGIELSPRQRAQLERYVGLVLVWGRRMNLTGAETEEEAARVLVLDALGCLADLPERGVIVDIGSGAGTPGVPIAVARPGVRVVLVDASRKKAGFLEVVLRELALANAEVLQARAETMGRAAAHRERYDAATARAVAPLPVLVELALPLVRVGGRAVFPKRPGAAQAVRDAREALRILGGTAEVRASGTIVVHKAAPTPPQYPRSPGVPERRPLVARGARAGSGGPVRSSSGGPGAVAPARRKR